MHILTHGLNTYTSDVRYKAMYNEGTDTWVLMINSVQLMDSGMFECQHSSVPVDIYAVQLTVVEFTVDIVGDAELFVQTDSSIILTCVASNLPQSAGDIEWRHNGHKVHSSQEMLVETVTDDIQRGTDEVQNLTSYLRIHSIKSQHGGKYQCGPTGLRKDFIQLQVLNDCVGSCQAAWVARLLDDWISLGDGG